MGLESGDTIYLDATAIIEAHAVGIWRPLVGGFRLATAGKCFQEVAAGNRPGGGRALVDLARIRREIVVHQVDEKALVEAVLAGGLDISRLHPGEKELLALVRTREGEWFISSQDLGCLRGGKALGLLDRFVSLEEIARVAGVRRQVAFRDHYTKQWLIAMRTRLRLGTL